MLSVCSSLDEYLGCFSRVTVVTNMAIDSQYRFSCGLGLCGLSADFGFVYKLPNHVLSLCLALSGRGRLWSPAVVDWVCFPTALPTQASFVSFLSLTIPEGVNC